MSALTYGIEPELDWHSLSDGLEPKFFIEGSLRNFLLGLLIGMCLSKGLLLVMVGEVESKN